MRVGSLQYLISIDAVRVLYAERDVRRTYVLGDAMEIVPQIDALREELQDAMAVARGRVPRLTDFSSGWGKALVPADVLESPPDVLVVVPHGALHDIPLHLIELSGGEPLGARVAVSYVSSRTLFALCAQRNPARGGVALADGPVYIGGGADVLRQDERFAGIAANFGARFDGESIVFKGGDGFPYSRSAVKAPCNGDRFPEAVCIVAHGFLNGDDHRRSGLLVELDTAGFGARPIQLDGETLIFRDLALAQPPAWLKTAVPAEVLTAAEFEIDAEIATRLVLLLGCSAGAGRVLQADEPASLAETFLHIGAASVIAPMWDTDVRATSDWADAFADAWIGTEATTAMAARDALRHLRDDGYGPERFGALTVRGDWV